MVGAKAMNDEMIEDAENMACAVIESALSGRSSDVLEILASYLKMIGSKMTAKDIYWNSEVDNG